MALAAVAWWVGVAWAGCGLLLAALCLGVEISERRAGTRQGGNLVVVGIALLFVALAWPVVIVVGVVLYRRERALERVCREGWKPPATAGGLTEEEWRAGTEPAELLGRLGKRVGGRQRSLFAVACVRRVWSRLGDPRSRAAVEVVERYADGQASQAQLGEALAEAETA